MVPVVFPLVIFDHIIVHLNENNFETEYERGEIWVEINLDFDMIVVRVL